MIPETSPSILTKERASAPSWTAKAAFYAYLLTVIALPFDSLVIVEGANLTIAKVAWVTLFLATLTSPRACFGRIPFAMFGFVAYLAGYVLAGQDRAPEFREWWGDFAYYMAVALFLTWVGSNVMARSKSARVALMAFSAGACLVSAQLILGIGVEDKGWSGMSRLTVNGQNPNNVAAICCMAVIALLGISRSAKRGRFALWTLAAICLFGILLTGSRGPIFAIGAGLVAFVLDGPSLARKARNFSVVAALCAVLAVASSALFADRTKAKTELRDQLVPEAIAMIQDDPSGWGPGRARFELARRVGQPASTQGISPHNLFLALMIEEGPMVASAMFAGLGLCFVAAWSSYRRPQGATPMALFLTLLVLNMTHAFHQERFFWFILAYILASGGQFLSISGNFSDRLSASSSLVR